MLGEFSARIGSLLSQEGANSSVAGLREAILRLKEHTLRRLLDAIQDACEDPRVLEDEHSRVLLARIIAAGLPHTFVALDSVLRASQDEILASELRFSLFVALSDVPELIPASEFSRALTSIERFLETVRSDEAQAAWMAGDLLGDHWPLEKSLPSLMNLSRTAIYPAGREAAIHGLSHALDRADKREQWRIVELLRAIVLNDEDRSVRRYAESVLGDLRGL